LKRFPSLVDPFVRSHQSAFVRVARG
jgi:hypothetical protein